jgi:hypothetical protein
MIGPSKMSDDDKKRVDLLVADIMQEGESAHETLTS